MPPRADEAAEFAVKPSNDAGRGPFEMDSGEKRLVELGYKQVGQSLYPLHNPVFLDISDRCSIVSNEMTPIITLTVSPRPSLLRITY